MKRTLTAAAAVLVGGAGAAGFAATANAAETPQLPTDVPADSALAQAAYHAAGALESAKRTVGDVVPLEEHLTGRSGDRVSGLATDALDTVGGTHVDTTGVVREVAPVGQVLPAAGDAAEELVPTGVAPVLDDLQPQPTTLPAHDVDLVGETVNGVVDSTTLGRTDGPLGISGGSTDVAGGLTQGLPVGEAATPTDVLDTANDLLTHSPLGG
ncbi:hypothetical protein [Saccharopolyspora hordei]|uniref:hypothetical protein n=1 Tax=Saccharopolyspora hordei TaxID=1838 RepID=UPI0031EC4A67